MTYRATPSSGAGWDICAGDSFRDLAGVRADHVITDPPYDEHCQSNQCSGSLARIHGIGVPKIELPFAALTGYEFAADLVRAARRWVLLFGTDRACGEVARAVGGSWVKGGVWYKPNSMGQLTRDRPASVCEYIALAHGEEKVRWNGAGSYGHWTCNGTRGEPGRHPNQKPLALLVELVRLFTDPGDLILDPFCGGGRIGEAAILCGRRYLGVDTSGDWRWVARQRCAHAERVGPVFRDDPRMLHATRMPKDELTSVMRSVAFVP